MIQRSRNFRGALLAALALGLWCVSEASAHGHGGSHGGGHAPRAPHVSAPHGGGFSMPRMPRAAAPAHTNLGGSRGRANHTASHARNTPSHVSSGTGNGKGHTSSLATTSRPGSSARNGLASTTGAGSSTATGRALTGTTNTGATSPAGTPVSTLGTALPSTYTYGTGPNARGYRAYGYGRGYLNTSYGRRYGYGRSQGNNRAIVARLRAVNMTLSRINHDYQGHRVRAMHQVTMAIRQLSHRSMIYRGAGFAPGTNNALAMGMGRGMGMGMGMRRGGGAGAGAGGGMGGRRGGGMNMNQAQSDAMMSQALRTLQGIGMQLGNQGVNMGHARASGHVQMAVRELNTALSIR